MHLDPQSVVVADNLDGLGKKDLARYVAFIYCFSGKASIMFNKQEYSLQSGDAAVFVVGRLIERVEAEADLVVKVLYISSELLTLSKPPQSNYGLHGFITLFHKPVMHLTEEEAQLCQRDFAVLERRAKSTEHDFYWECLIVVLQMFYYDIYKVQIRLYGKDTMSLQNASISGQFLEMLQNGDYRMYRQLAYYADKLNITPKHLSEVVRKNTGVTANHWINLLTSLEILEHLSDPSVPISEIVYKFHFSSPSYFVRFVQKHLGTTPTDLRGRSKK